MIPLITERLKGYHYREWLFAFAIIVSSFVALIAFLASYQHQYELVIRHHQTHWVGALYPLSVDFLIVAATLVLWYAATQGWGRPLGVWAVLIISIAVSACANLAADYQDAWSGTGPCISVWPAVALLGAYEMVIWVVRKRRKDHDASAGLDADSRTSPRTTRILQFRRNRVGISGPERRLPLSSPGREGSNGSQRMDRSQLSVSANACGHASLNGNPGQLTRCPDCSRLVKVP